ncbi:hypothetical protein VTO42DRAFT_7045 [Malbranchea cinnamomea]
MAGMEEVEIHSKSYLVRWINVESEHTISWSIQPHKKSLNFGIFKHPGTSGPLGSNAASVPSNGEHTELAKDGSKAEGSASFVTEKLKAIGLRPISWVGRCEADKISQGTYDVGANEGGNYALVFDNTFSKQLSKTATFVLLTYPTNCPPRSGHQVHHSQALTTSIGNSLSTRSPNVITSESTESLRHTRGYAWSGAAGNAKVPPGSSGSSQSFPTPVHTGILHKRRRKRHQGYARRFFTLDFTTSTLSYYHDRNSSALRGAIPLSLAAVATNDQTREISIDSGAEIWHLRALNDTDFTVWKRALEKASNASRTTQSEPKQLKVRTQLSPSSAIEKVDSKAWAAVEQLVVKVASARDTVRTLAQDTDPKYMFSPSEPRGRSPSPSVRRVSDTNADEALDSKEKRSFWKLKSSKDANSIGSRHNASHKASSLVPPVESSPKVIANGTHGKLHDELMSLLHHLNSVVSDFSNLLLEQKQMRPPPATSAQNRRSMDSDVSEEFFDAEDGNTSPLLTMHRDSEDEAAKDEAPPTAVEDDELSGSDVEEEEELRPTADQTSSLFPAKPKSISPLPLDPVPRRTKVAPPKVLPPSLISFLRKNVGKDLSTISMPVTANEPTSLLQRAAEALEYSQLLDQAASATDGVERLIYVTAFALSVLSNSRVKERAIRKPFNPMLGETFELVREDRGFRFIAEKVSHRPVQLALQADSMHWSFSQSPKPSQKFWGKSSEIITDGKIRLTLHSSGEHFSWSAPTSFLRNIIAGEKYVEPVGEMSVLNETTGQKAIASFKAGGMFSGRSEEVTVKTFDSYNDELPLGLQGTWTGSLQLTEHGNVTNTTIWQVGPLVDKPAKHYGFTSFVATLNEITPIERGKLPPTDSRNRPDQRALEEGDIDRAEDLKIQLEERQRQRRREMEAAGQRWQPRWFTKVAGGSADGGEEVWKLKTGKDGYWEERARGEWTGVVPVFQL